MESTFNYPLNHHNNEMHRQVGSLTKHTSVWVSFFRGLFIVQNMAGFRGALLQIYLKMKVQLHIKENCNLLFVYFPVKEINKVLKHAAFFVALLMTR